MGVEKYSSRDLELEVLAFNQLINEFNKSIDYDQEKIKAYSRDIASLRAKVRDDIAGLIGTGTAMVGTKVLIKFAKKIKGIGGKIIRGGLNIVLIGEIIVVFDIVKDIVVKTKLIELDTQQMDQYTLDVSTLEDLVISFNDVLKYVDEVQSNLKFISDEWGSLQSGIDLAIEKMNNVDEDIDNKEYQAALQEVINSKNAWDNVAKQTEELSLDVNVKDTVIDIDSLPESDDSDQESTKKMEAIESQIANTKSYPAMQYYNKI